MSSKYTTDADYMDYLAKLQIKEDIDCYIKQLLEAEFISLKQATKITSRVIETNLQNTIVFGVKNKPNYANGKLMLIDVIKNHCKRMEINHEEILTYLILAE